MSVRPPLPPLDRLRALAGAILGALVWVVWLGAGPVSLAGQGAPVLDAEGEAEHDTVGLVTFAFDFPPDARVEEIDALLGRPFWAVEDPLLETDGSVYFVLTRAASLVRAGPDDDVPLIAVIRANRSEPLDLWDEVGLSDGNTEGMDLHPSFPLAPFTVARFRPIPAPRGPRTRVRVPLVRLDRAAGRVLMEDGRPAAGARVWLHCEWARGATSTGERIETVTGPDGTFSVPCRAQEIRGISVAAPSKRGDEVPLFPEQSLSEEQIRAAVEAPSGARVTLDYGRSVEVSFACADGKPIESARVSVYREGARWPIASGLTNAQGAVLLEGLPRGAIEVTAEGRPAAAPPQGSTAIVCDPRRWDVPPGTTLWGSAHLAEVPLPVGRVRMTASKGAPVTGHVTGIPAEFESDVWIHAERPDRPGSWSHSRAPFATADLESGTFAGRLPPGDFRVFAEWYVDRKRHRSAPVQVCVGPGGAGLCLAMDSPQSVSGRVVDADSEGLPGVSVRVRATTSRNAGTDRTATTDSDGRFTVSDLAPGEHRVMVSDDEHWMESSHRVTLRPGSQVRGLVLRTVRFARIEVTVTDAEGQPVQDTAVAVQRPDGQFAGGLRFGTTDDQGRAVVTQVAPGPIMLSVDARGEFVHSHDSPLLVERKTIVLEPGETGNVRFVLGRRSVATVTGVITEDGWPAAGLLVQLKDGAGVHAQGWTDRDGRYRLETHQVGPTRLQIAKGSMEQPFRIEPIEVKPGETLRPVLALPVGSVLVYAASGTRRILGYPHPAIVPADSPPGAPAIGEASLNNDGTAHFPHVAPGTYRVEWRAWRRGAECVIEGGGSEPVTVGSSKIPVQVELNWP